MVLQLNRDDFLNDYWDYRPGESAVWICPTGGGKSHFMYQALDKALIQNPGLTATSAMPKPADATTYQWAQQLNLQVTDSYPFPTAWPWQDKPRGYVFWPKHIKDDEDVNQAHLQKQFKKMLSGEYWRGNNITCVDDAYLIACLMHLGIYCDKFLTAGRSNKAGMFGTLQQPRGTIQGGSVSSFWYNQPTHMFLGKDGNANNRDRFAEIGCGLDPKVISDIVANLRVYQIGDSSVSEVLYLDRRGPYLAVIGV
jgi:hypothetical protein